MEITPEDLKSFTQEVKTAFEAKKIRGPVHLSGGNEEILIEIFKKIDKNDWVLSTWRSHYHALLHGIPREKVMAEILAGRSMALHFPEHKFLTSAIVGGIAPIAVGLASQGQKVWCFLGDAAFYTGSVQESLRYAEGHDLPITFVFERNGYATNSPVREAWGEVIGRKRLGYDYERTEPHCGGDHYVSF